MFLTDSVFFALCACIDDSMVFFEEFFSIEKLEYSRYNARIKYEWVATVLIVVICFLILTDLAKVLLSFV